MDNLMIVETKEGKTFKVAFISFEGPSFIEPEKYITFLEIGEEGRKTIGSIEISKLKSITTVK